MMNKKRTIATLASMIIGINTVPMCVNNVYANDVVTEQVTITDSESITTSIPYMTWDNEKKQLVNAEPCTDYTVVTRDTTTFEDGKTYVVNEDVIIFSKSIKVNGNASLILCDNCTFEAVYGIILNTNNKLTIYGQYSSTGKLIAGNKEQSVSYYHAGIGGIHQDNTGSNGTGTLIIDGGIVEAYGGKDSAGIGGGFQGNGGTVVINSGDIRAIGNNGSAGIGSGNNCTYGSGGTVVINGGNIYAKGDYGAGIGGSESGQGANVTINGGNVLAIGMGNSDTIYASGIGAGYYKTGNDGLLKLGENVRLETSKNGKDWMEVTSVEKREVYMRTSVINVESTDENISNISNESKTDTNYIDRIKELEEENAKLKEENNNLQRVLASYGNRAYGDMNNDNIIDGRDATILLTYYAKISVGYVGSLDNFIREQNGE